MSTILKKNGGNIALIAVWVLMVVIVSVLSSMDLVAGIGITVVFVGLALCIVSLTRYKLGFYIYITVTVFLPMLQRMSGSRQNIGLVMDALLLCTLFGCIIRRGDASFKRVKFSKEPILICYYLYIIWLCVEIVNPTGGSLFGWLVFMRVFMRSMLLIYIGLNLFATMKDVHTFFKYWLFIGTLAALYCCIQQWIGLMPFEKAYLYKYRDRFGTTMIAGGIRLFSFMADAAVLGIIMACNVLVCLILLTASRFTIKLGYKALLVVSAILQVLALGYTGTRTGYVMLPMGMIVFFLASIQKRNTILIAIVFTLAAVAILFGPFHGNPTIVRVRTAFLGSENASVNVRDKNRHMIQPFIYKHPLGGGLLSTGGNAALVNPGGSMLADFQTDNGYLRLVLESGYAGMFLIAGVLFFIVQGAVYNYFRAGNELDKLLMISIAAAVFAMCIAMYAQDATSLVESAIMLSVYTAITIKVKYI
ncbi:O-antigen ligase family protein [Chitinophaga solisilvae]|uniref:O-antigen ligase-related domain-containing protein n=1 Tax=Chitinophaga solisilvae TaxID=1233460 RepID=A0A3S1JD07_9BACT|nr:O-antigen ligase family protein [Chitinophaga solisilvae]NSL86698.1 hypothetical protein [Chitinophaga solisilvae]